MCLSYFFLEKMLIFLFFFENSCASTNRGERNEKELNFELLFSFLLEEFVRRRIFL